MFVTRAIDDFTTSLLCDGSKSRCTRITLLVDKESRVSVTFVVTASPFVSDSGIDSLVMLLYEVSGLMTVVVVAAGADGDEP